MRESSVSSKTGGRHTFQVPVTLHKDSSFVTAKPPVRVVSHVSHSDSVDRPASRINRSQSLASNVSVESIYSQEELAVSHSETKSHSHSAPRHATPVSEHSVLASPLVKHSFPEPVPSKNLVCKHRKPILSVRMGPSISFQPQPKFFSWSPIET